MNGRRSTFRQFLFDFLAGMLLIGLAAVGVSLVVWVFGHVFGCETPEIEEESCRSTLGSECCWYEGEFGTSAECEEPFECRYGVIEVVDGEPVFKQFEDGVCACPFSDGPMDYTISPEMLDIGTPCGAAANTDL